MPTNLIVIPARLNSSRLPRKILADIEGHSVISRVIQRCTQAKKAQSILVATDSTEIYDEARSSGALACLTSSEHNCGTDRIAEAITKHPAKHIVNVQGDEPFIDPHLIDSLFTALEEGESMVSAATSITNDALGDPSNVKVVLNADNYALYFSRSIIPHNRDNHPNVPYWCHMGIYGYQHHIIQKLTNLKPVPLEQAESLEQLRALYYNIPIKIILTHTQALSIDTPQDLQQARDMIRTSQQ